MARTIKRIEDFQVNRHPLSPASTCGDNAKCCGARYDTGMTSWLRGTNWFQRIALVLLAVAAVLGVYLRARGKDGTGLLILALLISLLAFRKQILWRVRNRL